MTERDEYTPSLEVLRREFEYRIRTAVTYGLGRGKTGDSADQDVAGWIDREIGAAMASLTVSQVIEAVRQEEREKAADAINAVRNHPTLIDLADKYGGWYQGQRTGLERAESIAREQGKEQGA